MLIRGLSLVNTVGQYTTCLYSVADTSLLSFLFIFKRKIRVACKPGCFISACALMFEMLLSLWKHFLHLFIRLKELLCHIVEYLVDVDIFLKLNCSLEIDNLTGS